MSNEKPILNAKGKDMEILKMNPQIGTSKSSFVDRTTGGKRSDSGEQFIAPDGGWGWLVAVASGISVLVTYPVLKQFGILFRKKFSNLGISSSQITTIINVQQAAAMCSGLINGPLFRRFSHRQVAIIGNILVFSGLFLAAFANSFSTYIISISLLYGTGRGIMFSTMTVTINTYFKEKRQEATSCQYAIAGMGPIVLPYIITFLVSYYGVAGTVLLLSGFSLHNLGCAAIYQPVKWHAKKLPRSRQLRDLARHRTDNSDSDTAYVFETATLEVNNQFIDSKGSHQDVTVRKPNEIPSEQKLLSDEEEIFGEPDDDPAKERSIFEKIAEIFDLNLLNDFGYVNIVIGLTLINMTQMNFHYLTPFILNEFGLDKHQIAAAMTAESICAFLGKIVLVFTVGRLKCENKYWLLCGSLTMIVGRIVLVYNRSSILVLACFALIGFSSSIMVVFWILIMPGYVPLNRLPAAIGLQRLIMGICNLITGPFIGLLRDATSYASILHIMNVVIGVVIISWLSEDLWKKRSLKIQKNTGRNN